MSIKVVLPQAYKLELEGDTILIYRDGALIHTLDATNCPNFVDYIKNDPRYPECWVYGHIEDNVFIVHSRTGATDA